VQYNTVLSFAAGNIFEVDGNRVQIGDRNRSLPISILIRESNNPGLTSGPVLDGRDLTPEDNGKNVIVLSEQSAIGSLVSGVNSLSDLGIKIGSSVLVRTGGSTQPFEVVGIVGNINRFTPNIASAYIPPNVPGVNSNYQINVLQIAPENLNQFLINMQSLPLIFTVDVTFIDGLLQRLIQQLSAIPIVVGLLSLLAAAVIMANTVSLTILERRRQIGILKALGLKRQRVLRVVLLENTIIGLLGGVLGIGVSSLGVSILTLLGSGSAIPLPSDATWITIGLITASVIIAWVATLLSARVVINERVTSILRYE
jgi:putative ABC transport system permease protein